MLTFVLEANTDLAFDVAKHLATAEAAKYLEEPMTLSWLNHGTGQHSPNVECCQEDGKESWEIYAESRGGAVRIEIANQYTFIFRDAAFRTG